jgi:hypothetical protein
METTKRDKLKNKLKHELLAMTSMSMYIGLLAERAKGLALDVCNGDKPPEKAIEELKISEAIKKALNKMEKRAIEASETNDKLKAESKEPDIVSMYFENYWSAALENGNKSCELHEKALGSVGDFVKIMVWDGEPKKSRPRVKCHGVLTLARPLLVDFDAESVFRFSGEEKIMLQPDELLELVRLLGYCETGIFFNNYRKIAYNLGEFAFWQTVWSLEKEEEAK